MVFFMGKDGMYENGRLISKSVQHPMADCEVSRVYWDEATQSVKQEIIPAEDIWDFTVGAASCRGEGKL